MKLAYILLLLPASMPAQPSRWITIPPPLAFAVDTHTVTSSGPWATACIKQSAPPDGPQPFGRKVVSYTVPEMQFSCNERLIATVASTSYDAKGVGAASYLPIVPTPKVIVPDSQGKAWNRMVCIIAQRKGLLASAQS